MQQAQKAAAVAEAQRRRRFGFKRERGIVQLQLAQGFLQVGVLIAVYGVKAAEDDGQSLAVARQRLGRTMLGQGQRVADPAVADSLDAGGDVADFAGHQLRHGLHARREDADPGDIKGLPGRHCPDLRARRNLAVADTHISHDAQIGIKVAVEDQGT